MRPRRPKVLAEPKGGADTMDAYTIDRLARRCAGLSRRRALGLFALAIAGGVAVPVARRGGPVGAQPATPVSSPAVDPPVEPTPQPTEPPPPPTVPSVPSGYCTQFVLAGGPTPADPIHVDDDLIVFINDLPIFQDRDGAAGVLAPVVFQASPGDELTVVGRDVQPCGRKIGPLWLHCAQGGEPRFLTAGEDTGCNPDRELPRNFYRESWEI
jgi:hypothetical protein